MYDQPVYIVISAKKKKHEKPAKSSVPFSELHPRGTFQGGRTYRFVPADDTHKY